MKNIYCFELNFKKLVFVIVFLCHEMINGQNLSDANSVEKSKQSYRLKEVSVSASKNNSSVTNLQSVPNSSTALTSSQLESVDLLHLQDLSKSVENFSARDAGSRSFNTIFGMRGLTGTQYFSESPIAVYLDDIPLGRSFTHSAKLQQMDSILIYRGAQPSLFGQNSEAGVMILNTKAPSKQWESSGSASYGNYNAQKYSFSTKGPAVKDRFFVGLSGYYDSRNGYLYNSTLGTHPDSQEGMGGNIHLKWTPSNELELSLLSIQEHSNDGEQRISSLTGDPFHVEHGVDGVTVVNANTTGFKIKHLSESMEILSVTAYRWWALDPYRVNLGFVPNPPLLLSMNLIEETWSEEIRFSSIPDTKENPSWSSGIYFSSEKSQFGFGRDLPASGSSDHAHNTLDDHVVAGFGHAIFPLTESLRISGGIRLDYRTKDDESHLVDFAGNPMQAYGEADFFNAAPQFGLSYDVDESQLLFANLAKGFKAGGFVPFPFRGSSGLSRYETEQVWTTDFGSKKTLIKDKLILNSAFFYSHADDYQFERYTSPVDYTVINANEVSIIGGEIEALLLPWRNFETGVGFGYSRAEFEKHVDIVTGQNYAGNRAPYVPEFGLTLHEQYNDPTGLMQRVEMQVAGDTYFDEANTPFLVQKPYVLFNARIGYEMAKGGVYLFGNNLTDEIYYGFKSAGVMAGTVGDPRTFGIEGRLNF